MALLLLALGGLGYLVFLWFVTGVLIPGEFASYGLVFTTVAAAVASFFSPCSFTVLPGYLAFAGAAQQRSPGGRLRVALVNGAMASLGVITATTLLGVLIAALGTAFAPQLSITGPSPNRLSQAIRISVGALILFLGLAHLLGLAHRLPLLGRISAWAMQAEGSGQPSRRSLYLYGAGYIIVGLG